MTKPLGINIIKSNVLPVEIIDEDTGEIVDIIHMVQNGDKIYVSKELFDGIKEHFDGGNDD